MTGNNQTPPQNNLLLTVKVFALMATVLGLLWFLDRTVTGN